MRVIRDNLWLCDDCTIVAVNNDTSGIADPQRLAEVERGIEALGRGLTLDFDSETGEGIESFSRMRCACCGTTLAGSRHRFAILGEETAKPAHQYRDIGCANARIRDLLAERAEMLEALRMIAEHVEGGKRLSADWIERIARAAIARATGAQP